MAPPTAVAMEVTPATVEALDRAMAEASAKTAKVIRAS